MQDMIRKIIEMDKDARRLTDEARQLKANAAEAAAEKRREVFENYLNMAHNRVDTIRRVEMESANELIQDIDRRTEAASAAMRERAEACREGWIAEIVAAVTEGDDLK